MDLLLTPWYKSLANAAKGANLQEKKQAQVSIVLVNSK